MRTTPNIHHRRRAAPAGLSAWVVAAAMVVALSATADLRAQSAAPSSSLERLDEVIVTATRTSERAEDLPYATSAITRAAFDEQLPRTLPDALREESSIMVQKTALGQGSPFIRGFTGFRTVLLVDGFRLNNSVFRDGPNQYWNTVDAWSLARVEVVKGPTSAQYGSDAVGGTVQAHTVAPRFETGGAPTFAGALYRYSSAEQSHLARIEAGARWGERTAFIAGSTWKNFGDLRAGRATGVQPKTGYGERDFDFKLEHRFTPAARLTLAHQSAELDDVWRTHATIYGLRWDGTRPGSNLARVLDQGRDLTYARLDAEDVAGAPTALHLGVAHHRQTEDEFRQRANLRVERQGFRVQTLGAFAHGRWDTTAGRWVAGGEFYRDNVDTFLREFDSAGVLTAERVQGPVADDAQHDLLGIFVEDRIVFGSRLEIMAGARLNQTRVRANKVATPGTGRAFALTAGTSALVGNARALFSLDRAERGKVFVGVAQGVRSPNLSDLTRFDIAEAGQIETPVSSLEPERFLTGEIGWRADYGRAVFEVIYYRTFIDRLIVRTPTGQTVSGLAEVTKRNSGRGYIHGLELDMRANVTTNLSLRGVATWMEGRLKSYPTAAPVLVEEPVSRLMPPTFVGSVRWQKGAWSAGASFTAVARADRLSTQDRVDTERIPPGGTPGYATLGLRASWQWQRRFTFSAALENLADKDYRIHGSGLNEPGRNLLVSSRVEF